MKNSKLKPFITRWLIFFTVILALLTAGTVIVQKISANILAKAQTVEMPKFTREELLASPEARVKYLSSRVRGAAFFVYTVKPRENLWTIAKKHGYSVHTVIGTNPQLKTYDVFINQKIMLPSSGGSLHPVQKDDTWETIAARYDADPEALRASNFGVANLSEAPYVFVAGKKPAVDLLNEDMQEKYALRSLFVSPLGGRLTSAFGKRRHPVTGKVSTHGGIDIAVKEGTWVGSAADGIVILSSTNAGHYGTAVFIDHQNGYVTHYGHLSKIHVRLGQKVKARQLIAKSGSTGRSTGPHLHFTIKKNNISIDPLKFLW